MDVDLYASWVKGLPQDKKALDILLRSEVIAGIEMQNLDSQVELVKGAGLKLSVHTPGGDLTLNLATPKTIAAFYGEQGKRLLEVIRLSDPGIVGFHLGYSATEVAKMNAIPNIPEPETIIDDRQVLLKILTETITRIQQRINPQKIILETLDFSREGQPVPWSIQKDEVRARERELEKVIKQYGVNAALMYVTDIDFVADILETTRAGFLFDIAHTWISAESKIYGGLFKGTIEDYFQEKLNVVAKQTRQLHLNVPGGNQENGYNDHHLPFTSSPLSERVMELVKVVYRQTDKNLRAITLEIKTDLPPVEHARFIVNQAERLLKRL